MDRFNIYYSIQIDRDCHSIRKSIDYVYYYVKSHWRDLNIVLMPANKMVPYLEMRFFNDFYVNIEYNDGRYKNLFEIKILKSEEMGKYSMESLKVNLTCLVSGFIYWFQNSYLPISPPYYSATIIDKIDFEDIANCVKLRHENDSSINSQLINENLLCRSILEEELYDIINFFMPNNKCVGKEDIVNEIKRKTKDKDIEMYNNEIMILKNENDRLSKENKDLNERLNKKIVDIKDSITGGDASIPQHNLLYEQFINFREQDISSLQALLKMRINIKQRALFIRSIAKEIFKEQITDNNISDTLNTIEKSIKDIGISDDINLTDFMQSLEEYVSKGINLAKNIKQAKPQGNFLWVENGAKFDSNCQQVIQGCEEGDVELTAYPGYFIVEADKAQRFFEKAVVYTINEINTSRI